MSTHAHGDYCHEWHRPEADSVGLCTWEHHSWGVSLDCDLPAVPGSDRCEEHAHPGQETA